MIGSSVDIASIMYNEEVLLPVWIESWLSIPFINKIYLVDGGSTDKSVEIAKKYGNRVSIITVPWKNDFARQRNIAIKLAKSNWVFQPDIDEIPCGTPNNNFLNVLNSDTINEIIIPYLKFYNFVQLWFFNNGNTPRLDNGVVYFGDKSTTTIFKKSHLTGYSKSLHEMPIYSSERQRFFSRKVSTLGELEHEFFIGHYDQAKHFLQAKRNNTTVEYEMGLKRARYRLISDATYNGKTYTKDWAEKVLRNNDVKALEELGDAQLASFENEHNRPFGYDAFELNNKIVKKYVS